MPGSCCAEDPSSEFTGLPVDASGNPSFVEDLSETVDAVGEFVEIAGVIIIVGGLALALVSFAVMWFRDHDQDVYTITRRSIGRSILLGLEVLVAGDIIRTVAVDPTFNSVGVLAAVVAIRTLLSFTLEVEISGRWPWQSSR